MKTTITTYAELEKYAKFFVHNNDKNPIRSLILFGLPGLGKSKSFQNEIKGHGHYVEGGKISPLRLYARLFKYRDETIVIDDVDKLLKDRDSASILKCATHDDKVKTVPWDSTKLLGKKSKLPTKFRTSSRICIIANSWKALNDSIDAIEDRSHVLHFVPDAAEVHKRVANWWKDAEIYEFFGEHLKFIQKPSCRQYNRAIEKKEMGEDWRKALLSHWGVSDREISFLAIQKEEFRTDGDRKAEWVRRHPSPDGRPNGYSPASYDRLKRDLLGDKS